MNAPEMFHLQLSRFIRAPREKVFDAFVTEGLLSQWKSPRGMQVAACSVDARVGGRYRVEMRSRDLLPRIRTAVPAGAAGTASDE